MTGENKFKTLIIAEAGVNHNGDIGKAKDLIDVAAEAGADWVKFQTFSADRLVTVLAPKASYQNQTTDSDESQFSMIKKLELTREMHECLIKHCKLRGIRFFSTGEWYGVRHLRSTSRMRGKSRKFTVWLVQSCHASMACPISIGSPSESGFSPY